MRGALYPSQPRTVSQETTFRNFTQQAARSARGAVYEDRRGSRRLATKARGGAGGGRKSGEMQRSAEGMGAPDFGATPRRRGNAVETALQVHETDRVVR